MQWEVDNHNIDVLVSETDVIEIVRWDDFAKMVYIPASMPKSEALWAIRNLLRQKRHAVSGLPVQDLSVFGKRWPVVAIRKSQKTYMQKGVIYSYISESQAKTPLENRIKDTLLEQVVFAALDKWEHFFSVTVAEIKFRKNARRPYIFNPKRGCITFDKALHRFTLEQIEYGVFRAVIASCNIANPDNRVLQRHFPNRKITEKIFSHEYPAYDYD